MFIPNQPIVYSPVGHCIYCGSINNDLSKEHIIPLGLGGNLILPKASCSSCAAITSKVERFCLKPMLGNIRNRLNLPTRHPKSKQENVPLEFLNQNGQINREFVPSMKLPMAALGFLFPSADLLRNLPPSENTEGKPYFRYVTSEIQLLNTSKEKKLFLGSINILTFCQMLAKIAHSYAIANLGNNAFHPLLLDLILGKSKTPNYLVGGDDLSKLPVQKNILHDIYLQDCLSNGIMYTLVVIRLFAFMGMPRYHVVVGEKN